jgi:hypothetical protein
LVLEGQDFPQIRQYVELPDFHLFKIGAVFVLYLPNDQCEMDETAPKNNRPTDRPLKASYTDEAIAEINQRFAEEEKRLKRFVLFLSISLAALMVIFIAWYYFFGSKSDAQPLFPQP